MSTAAASAPAQSKKSTDPSPVAEAPKDSRQTIEARAVREDLAHVAAELQQSGGDRVPLRAAGACLFAAHMAAVLGRDKVAAMSANEIQAYAANFRARYPAAWGRAAMSHVMGFVQTLVRYGLEHDTLEAYQKAVGQLSA